MLPFKDCLATVARLPAPADFLFPSLFARLAFPMVGVYTLDSTGRVGTAVVCVALAERAHRKCVWKLLLCEECFWKQSESIVQEFEIPSILG